MIKNNPIFFHKHKRVLTILTVMVLLLPGAVFPCSIFKYSSNGSVFFCGNEDWSAKDPAFRTFPAKKNEYAYILVGWDRYLPSYAQAGINAKGLCFDWATVPAQKFSGDRSKTEISQDFTVDILKNCADIREALKYIGQFNIPHFAEEHIMLADRSGRSCIIEYNNGRVIVIENSDEYHFMTNFHISAPSLGWYPCERYEKMTLFFGESGDKKNLLPKLLDEIHQEGDYPTIYSYIFNLTDMELIFYYNHDYRSEKKFSFFQSVRRKETIRLYN